ncbi:MAG: amidohydrolase family protein, partial [Lachnospiraceae bacterium]|nr:amidohydrolase family protein [Lachnospiraceae bacterium]
LETALALGITKLVKPGYISLYQLIERMSTNPAGLYGLQAGDLSKGSPADIVIFDPDESRTVEASGLHSISANSPFIGMKLQGRVRYTVSEGNIVFGA